MGAAIVAEGALYARNVRTEGYKTAIAKTICEANVKQGEPKRETRSIPGPPASAVRSGESLV